MLLPVFLLSISVYSVYASEEKTSQSQACEINQGPCLRKIGGASVIFDIEPKPVKANRELAFTVTLRGVKEYDSLRLKLQMPGMYMGNNVVKLVRSGEGIYTGKGVAPKCGSGKKLWSASVELPGLILPETSFLFNVLY